jgi:general secretion pathway protein N
MFGALFMLALIVLLPLRLVLGGYDLDRSRIAAREVSGSVWFGHVREAQVGGVALGDVRAELSPWTLLLGRARVKLATPDDAAHAIHGAIETTRHGIGLDSMIASLPAGDAFAPLPIGAIDLDAVSVRFVDGQCESADGRVKVTLTGDLGGIDLGQGLSGVARCDGGALLLPLASQAGTERIALRLWPTGRFGAEVGVKPIDASAAQKLEAKGFRPSPSGERLTLEGKF